MEKLTSILRLFFFCWLISSNMLLCEEFNFKYYKVENGLSSNSINAIIQDSDGFIWIGAEGLNRFDGYNFQKFKHIPQDTTSLTNNYVYTLLEDFRKQLWIGTGKGVCIYDMIKKKFRPLNAKTTDGTQIKSRVLNIIQDERNNIWISTSLQGVFVYHTNGQVNQFTFSDQVMDANEPIYTTCLYKDSENIIWVSVNNTKYQIYKLDTIANKFIPAFPHISQRKLHQLSSFAITEDSDGTLWFGSWYNGLFEIDKEQGEIIDNYLNKGGKIRNIHTLTEYVPGELLIGSNDGLTIFQISKEKGNRLLAHLQEPYISNRFVYPIYRDREGGLWIGTYYGGINYASPNRNYFTSYTHNPYRNSINGNVISQFCEDRKGNLWIATDDGGLNYFDTKSGLFSLYNSIGKNGKLSTQNVHALCIDDDKLWVGTYQGGLNVIDLKKRKITYYYSDSKDSTTLQANSIYTIVKDSYGNIWIGTTGGLDLYDREKDNFRRIICIDEFINDIQQVNNIIWVATNGKGLYAYNQHNDKWERYQFDIKDTSSIISDFVTCLTLDNSNRLWIGTDCGLCYIDSLEQGFLKVNSNFLGHSISNIFCVDKYLWITTPNGLIWFNPENNQQRIFTKDDGLLSNQFIQQAGIKSACGRIYIGTANGFNSFYPNQIAVNKSIPSIEITDFQLFNKSVNLNEYLMQKKDSILEIRLAYNKNSFSFEYTALSFFAPEKNEYAYILEGFDAEWNYVNKERKASYTNIPPGEYLFRVKASNNDGVWNETGKVIRVVITPPFWWNRWSVSFYLLLIILSLVYISDQLQKKTEAKKRKEIRKIEALKEKEAYDSKLEFFTTIAHEIRTPVSLIIGPLEQIISKTKKLPVKIANDLNIIERNSQRLLALVNQLLDFQKIEKRAIQLSFTRQNIYEFLQIIYDQFKLYESYKKHKFIFNYNTKDVFVDIDVENLTKVVWKIRSKLPPIRQFKMIPFANGN